MKKALSVVENNRSVVEERCRSKIRRMSISFRQHKAEAALGATYRTGISFRQHEAEAAHGAIH